MKTSAFLSHVRDLTGRNIPSSVNAGDIRLREGLADDQRVLDWSQFNELLLFVQKDRVERPFFDHFFEPPLSIGAIGEGVRRFRIAAMLRFGNFAHGFKVWSRITSESAFRREMEQLPNSGTPRKGIPGRADALIQIEPIQREETHLVGETTSAKILADSAIMKVLEATLGKDPESFEALIREFNKSIHKEYHRQFERMVERFRNNHKDATVDDFRKAVDQSAAVIETLSDQCRTVIEKAERNLETYLTWDYIDVYIATSMRQKQDFESVHSFAEELMANPYLRDRGLDDEDNESLKLRFFDPTQSKAANRVDKGLVEALMLKRALCTIYSVQDSDTLGKDSELAATLAQGKPVIAFVPEWHEQEIRDRTEEILDSDISLPYGRYNLWAHESEPFRERCQTEFQHLIKDLIARQRRRLWSSEEAGISLREMGSAGVAGEFARACAEAEKDLLDKRFGVLTRFHPLAFQVNLQRGVANGLLVVRTVENCAKLVRAIALRRMSFEIDESDGVFYLREKISGSPFRVVTGSGMLTNCFWSFYLREEGSYDASRTDDATY